MFSFVAVLMLVLPVVRIGAISKAENIRAMAWVNAGGWYSFAGWLGHWVAFNGDGIFAAHKNVTILQQRVKKAPGEYGYFYVPVDFNPRAVQIGIMEVVGGRNKEHSAADLFPLAHPDKIWRPTQLVEVDSADFHGSHLFLVDTGADMVTFGHKQGVAMGFVEIEREPVYQARGLGECGARLREVMLDIDGASLDSVRVYWLACELAVPLLGRQDVFSHFRVTFDMDAGTVTFARKAPVKEKDEL